MYRVTPPTGKKIIMAWVWVTSMIATTFITAGAVLDMAGSAYAQEPVLEGEACKAEPNPEDKLNSNPFCPDEDPDTLDEPPITSSSATAFNDDEFAGSQVESTACEEASGPTPPACIAGSRRR